MTKKILIPATFILAIIAFLLWWFSTAQVLKRRSLDLIDCVRMEEGTGRVQRAFKADNLKDYITDTITVTYPQMKSTFNHQYSTNLPISLDEDQAKSALLYLTELAEWIKVENESVEVLKHNENAATVKISFDITSKLKNMTEQSASLTGVLTFQYIEKRWLMAEATFNSSN